MALKNNECLAKEKKQIGWIEKTRIYPSELIFTAKMDTGARNSSINAHNIVEFERDGQTWVRFEIVNNKQISSIIELPLVREAIIKRHFGKKQQRYVVMLGICLGKIYKETEVTLVDRKGFLYAILIGRSFLKKDFVVDPAQQFTLKPICRIPNQEDE
jgi:hypothetical protein